MSSYKHKQTTYLLVNHKKMEGKEKCEKKIFKWKMNRCEKKQFPTKKTEQQIKFAHFYAFKACI